MAILRLEDGTIYTHYSDIALELAPLHIQLQYCPLNRNFPLSSLLEQDILTLTEKGEVLQAISSHFTALKRAYKYRWYDLMVLHPGSPHLYPLLNQCYRCHTHADNEALYILAGECILGFVRPDGSQVELIVQAEEFINVPPAVEHWFSLTTSLHLKAVRYFTNVEGWIPNYTSTEIYFQPNITHKYRNY